MIKKITNVEDILELGDDDTICEIDPDSIIRYIYFNRFAENPKININELRGVYAKSVNMLYEKKRYTDSIKLNKQDIEKLCLLPL